MEIVAYRGSDISIPLNLTNPDGSPYDLTGCTLFLTIKNRTGYNSTDSTDADALLKYTSTDIPSPAAGSYTFDIPHDDMETLMPGSYNIGFRLKDALGDIQPGPEGTLSVKATTTRRTS